MDDWGILTTSERISWIVFASQRIYVRVMLDGRAQTKCLADLPDDVQNAEIMRLADRDVPPTELVKQL
jgi:hypothetical protein